MRILFQGDSVTDCGRNRADMHDLGPGYPHYAAQLIREAMPGAALEFINKGVSGDRTGNLLNRWQADAIDLAPDLISILIGINDTWRAFDSNDPTPAEVYEDNYRRLLTDLKQHTKAKILMLEPFLMHTTPSEKAEFHPDLDLKIQAARRLAREFADAYVPLDGLFAAACVGVEPSHWAGDGIHPTADGAQFIARHYAAAALPLLK